MIGLLWAWRRAIGWGLVVAAVGLAGWRVSAWKEAHEALPGVRDALEREEACLDGSKCAERVATLVARQEQATKEAIEGYERELEDLRNRPVPRRVIRVCPDPGDVQNPRSPGAADGARPGSAVVQRPDELDTGPLRELAREADELAARLRALQQWNRDLAN